MNRISVNGSSSYDVVIENGIINRIGEFISDELGGNKAMIVTDSVVGTLYLGDVTSSLREAGYQTSSIVLPAGEASKSFENYEFLVTQFSEEKLSRDDIIIALGGGMIGDITGFAASTFKRGLRCVQVPTSLLAMVDSSVGGKTAINLANAKNQIGTFYNPALVVCDPLVLSTLPKEVILDGYAEIIKYSILSDAAIIDSLREAVAASDYTEVIAKSVTTKRDIVEMDERDNDFRQYLNLGHLIGHAIEASTEYNVSHGYAVAQGLAFEAKGCAFSGLTSFGVYSEIASLLEEFGFDLTDSYEVDELLPIIAKDKRIKGSDIELIVPKAVGECFMKNMPLDRMASFLKLAL